MRDKLFDALTKINHTHDVSELDQPIGQRM